MKRAARANRQIKQEIVTIDDDEPAAKQQILKSVKMEVQSSEPPPPLTVQELQEKLKKSEDRCQRAIQIAGQHLASKEQLERLIEKKPNIVQDGRVEELDKKVRDLTTELEAERKRGIEEEIRYTQTVRDLMAELEVERKKGMEEEKRYTETVRGLTTELEAEKKRGVEQRKRYNERMAELTKQLEEERRRGISTRVIERESVSKYVDGEIKKVKEELTIERARVRKLTNELEIERKKGIQNQANVCQRIAPAKNEDGDIKKVRKELAIQRAKYATLMEQLKNQKTTVKTRGINIDVAHRTISQLRKELAPMQEEHEKDQERITEMETAMAKLKEELAYTRTEHEKDQKRITDYAAKLALYEVGSQPPVPPLLSLRLPQLQQPAPQPAPSSAPPLGLIHSRLQQPVNVNKTLFEALGLGGGGGTAPAPTGPFGAPDRAPHVSLYLHLPNAQPAQTGPFGVFIATTPHSTNILELLSPHSKGCIPLDKALGLLRAGYDSCDAKIWHKFCLSDINSKFVCAVCTSVHSKWELLKHFFAPEHLEKVRASGAGVSEIAVKHWLFWMQQAAPTAVAAPAAASPAPAAPAAASGPSSFGLPLSLSSPSPLPSSALPPSLSSPSSLVRPSSSPRSLTLSSSSLLPSAVPGDSYGDVKMELE